jgi:hypothetical protein
MGGEDYNVTTEQHASGGLGVRNTIGFRAIIEKVPSVFVQ